MSRFSPVRRGPALLLAAISGVAVFLSFPAWDYYALAFVALAPLMRACDGRTVGAALGMGWLMGFVTNLGGFYWIAAMAKVYGYMPWPLAVGLLVLLAAQQALAWSFGAGIATWAQRRGVAGYVAWPAGIAVAEAALPMVFPWRFGHSQYLNGPIAQLAELGGVGLISVWLVMCNAAVYAILWRRGDPRVASLLLTVPTAAALAWGAGRAADIAEEAAAAPTVRVGMVQANIALGDKGGEHALLDNLRAHQRLSLRAVEQGAELLVWPETAYEGPAYSYTNAAVADEAAARMASRVRRVLLRDVTWIPTGTSPSSGQGATPHAEVAPQLDHRVPLLTGAVMYSERTPEERADAAPRGGRPPSHWAHNAALLLGGDGRVLGSYDKALLMPFTEHVPLGQWMWRVLGLNLYDMIPAAGDFFVGSPTEGFVLPHDGRDLRIGIMVCYEDIMAGFGRAIHAGRPHFIVNVTNDAWFLDTSEPALHLALATFRTIEQRVALVRSTNTGISAFVDATGRIVARTPTYEEATLLWDVPLVEARTTLFMRAGDWPPWCWLTLTVWLAWRRRSRGVQTGSPSNGG